MIDHTDSLISERTCLVECEKYNTMRVMWLPSPVKIIIFNSIWSQHRTSSFSKQASSIPLYSNTWLFYSDPSQQGKSVDIRWLYSPVLIFARSFVFRMKSWWHHCTLSWPSNWSDTPTRELTLLSIRNTTWWIIKSNSSLWPEWAFLESAIKAFTVNSNI